MVILMEQMKRKYHKNDSAASRAYYEKLYGVLDPKKVSSVPPEAPEEPKLVLLPVAPPETKPPESVPVNPEEVS